jgi:Transglutaminase-like superfamily
MLKQLKRFFHYPFSKKLLFFETICLSLIARILVFLVPFNFTKRLLGLKPSESEVLKKAHSIPQSGQGKAIWSMINTVHRYLPWRNTCLVQAITAKILLKRRKGESVIVMGLKKAETGELKAHAWLIYEGGVVTGFDENQEFTAVAFLA